MQTKQIKILLFLLGLLLTQPLTTHAQTPSTLNQYIQNPAAPLPAAIQAGEVATSSLLVQCQPYLQDSSAQVRARAYQLLHQNGQQRSKQGSGIAEQQQVVSYFMAALAQDSSSTKRQLIRHLSQYPPAAYSAAAQADLEQLIRHGQPLYYEHLLQLGGYVGINNSLLQSVADSTQVADYKNAAKLALARNGDERSLRAFRKNIQKIEVNDDFVYQVLPLVVYVRDKASIDYLLDLILRQSKDCTHPAPDVSRSMVCAYRLMETVAPIIVDFPVQVGKSGDLDVEDYEEALATVRAWIVANKESYALNKAIPRSRAGCAACELPFASGKNQAPVEQTHKFALHGASISTTHTHTSPP